MTLSNGMNKHETMSENSLNGRLKSALAESNTEDRPSSYLARLPRRRGQPFPTIDQPSSQTPAGSDRLNLDFPVWLAFGA